ncbi:MAG: CoB--CoM heterodisulfide reductase iron-sulfur subunit A family protein [Deltaproteobacteria bacterium]|nr:CoB--CoM heterodisulfide reductase iron-sulfur subunit A family protein [Deltaproteobacteria bacterium]MBW1968051.1 CoB--CoM heterodisulfide reductase iron-sulfur subunit A family protein [Deltaproteobacteria bacterium]MBW2155188.1 CoB--CoM heterodisulfide reductase iron-sulfur subunit A family protein [Deltaproteobacteria bacterium]MBW2225894.1 CoB--CoM heterodisulfide reductase iron-sulfur subunit A family protein [Deltaproteobacteria bacterium]MBW2325272.1 CoB--CoM heterodisulfide reducta
MQDQNKLKQNNTVLVIGGGVGGIRAAMDLAESNRDVVLIDKAYSIGGLMTQLDRTFPTNNCDLCTLSPNLSESGRQLHIELLAMTQVAEVQGEAGNFKLKLITEPRYIDLDKCTACGDCYKQFPECVRFTPGLDHRAPTCMRYPQAIPHAFSIDIEKCKDIDGLVKVCQAGAILPEDTQKIREVESGAIVLAPGAEVFDPGKLDSLGHAANPDVVTSLEYERILSASGPSQGELVRPSDGKQPKKIAWIQCVGSRSLHEGAASYCSSACCMFALKEAIVTKERFQDSIETTIFYMDMRTFGKDYELYLNRAKDDYGIRLVRSRPHSVFHDSETGSLSIIYTPHDSNTNVTEDFDMVVLSTGFKVSRDVQDLAVKLGVELNEHHFAKTDSFSPVATSMPGIYVCGMFESPKDIPETMVQASAAAFCASKDLPVIPEIPESIEEFPPERDVSRESLKIGVFVCDCGLNIGGVIDAQGLADYAGTLPDVEVSEMIGHGCSRESLAYVENVIVEKNLNRVVIGGCSPRTHETKFQDALRRAGLNKYLVEIANIRDQDTWVHFDQPDNASIKGQELIRMATTSVALSRPLTDNVFPMNKDVLVVGGGVTGMNAALSMADIGFKVYLAERFGELGGVAKKIHKTIEGDDVQGYMTDLIDRTTQHDRIEVITSAFIVDHTGMPGMFKTGFQVAPQMFYRQITHGVTILATGALPNQPKEYLLGEHEKVFTQLDMDAVLEDHPDKIKDVANVVMIQCVGSRCPENPNCSRVCCQSAVKNALRILELNPTARIFVLYQDMRTYGFYEDYYKKAREKGVVFVQYEANEPPEVQAVDEQLEVTFNDTILNRKVSVYADCLCLSTGFIADEESTEDLGRIFHIPKTIDNYFLEDHIKLRPIDLPVPGFFVAGTAHAPKTIRECIAQAQAAASRAHCLLAKDTLNLGAAIARVEKEKCAACLICVRACPFNIPFINADGYSEIDQAQCHGCGICAAECPAKAIQLMQYEDDQIMAKLTGLLERVN